MAKDAYAQPWKEFARRWKKFCTPPGRPSEQAVAVYRRFVRQALQDHKHKPRILILGATPELRDLASEFKAEVTIIDVNLEMILAMSELCRKKNPQEIIIRASWLDNPLAGQYWDIVLGDLVISNLPRDKQKNLLQEVKRLLQPRGHFVTKVEVMPNAKGVADFDQILAKYAQIPYHKNRAMELFCHLHNHAWDSRTETSDLSKVREWMEKYKIDYKYTDVTNRTNVKLYKHPNKKITVYLNRIWKMWKPLEKQWAFKRPEDASKQFSPHFKIIEKVVLHDCYYREVDEGFPIWFCQAR